MVGFRISYYFRFEDAFIGGESFPVRFELYRVPWYLSVHIVCDVNLSTATAVF